MKKAMLPLNLGVLSLSDAQLKTIRPITTLDIFDGPGGNFHDDGLFSTVTFGRVGDPLRDRRFGYIELRAPVIHPVIYLRLVRLKKLYGGILSGDEYAVFNKETGDFEKADMLTGETGYDFFARHLPKLTPAKTGSSIRDLRIDFFNKYRDKVFIKQLLVLPAGLREADIDANGRLSMDEINELYQSVLITTRNLPEKLAGESLPPYDRVRYSLTLRVVEIHNYIEKLLSGKKGIIQSRWASRRVFNTSRNVLTSLDVAVPDLRQPNRPGFRSVVVGIHQAAKGVLPKTIFYLKQTLISDVFDTSTNSVQLVEPTTMKATWVDLTTEDMDTWSTNEGLEKVINELAVPEKRNRPILINNHYLALIYVDDKQQYKIIRSIDELPEGADPKFVRPLTYIELIYLAGVDHWQTFSAFVTRYPVENYFSSIPCRTYVKTTSTGEMRYRLNDNWEREPVVGLALEFPRLIPGKVPLYHDSISVPPSALKPLGGD